MHLCANQKSFHIHTSGHFKDTIPTAAQEGKTWLLEEGEIHLSPGHTNSATHLSHLDELNEDFSSELRGGAAEHHQLHPLGDAVAQGYGPLHGGVLLHTAVHHVILIV